MTLRKLAGLLAAFGLTLGLIGGGVGAVFQDQVTAVQNISVGTFECKIYSAAPAAAVIAADGKSVSYTAPTIMSSAAGSAPFSFTVQNTGSIPDLLTVSTNPVTTPPWSIIGAPFAPVPLAAGAMHTYDTGIAWTELQTGMQGGSVTWTVNCGENAPAPIFDNTPAVLAGNYPSVAFESTSTSEWGTAVTFAGTARKLAAATVTMSSWACETGSGTTCVTTPGHTFDVPITFKVYSVSGTAVGSVVATTTQTFAIPYRPSYDATHCSGTGKWWDGSACMNGKAANITFTFAGETLPDNVIFGISYNTQTHGYSPTGVAGPIDSLNVACYPGVGAQSGTVGVQPSVGTFPDPLGTYLNSSYSGFYLDNGATGTFRLDTGTSWNDLASIGPWGGYEPSVQITATN